MSKKNLFEEIIGHEPRTLNAPFTTFLNNNLYDNLVKDSKLYILPEEARQHLQWSWDDHTYTTTQVKPIMTSNVESMTTLFKNAGYVTSAKDDSAENNDVDYRFNEDKYLEEAWEHIDSTYSSHYGSNIQATEVIIDAGHGTGFNIGNIMKYAKRYGKKAGYNRKDLLKIIHYTVMQLYVHDLEELDSK